MRAESWCERAAGVPGAEAVARNAALSADAANGRRCACARDHRAGQRVRPLRLPADHGTVASQGLASGQGSGAGHLAAREGLKVPQKQRARGRLWLNDGSCVRLTPKRANHVWSYDFVSAMTHDGRTLGMPTLIDEYTRESLAIRVARRPRVRGGGVAEVAGKSRNGNIVHRAGESMGERLLRKFQREVAR